MSKPVWLTFRNVWWVLITAATAIFFCTRLPAIWEGKSAPVDVFIFLVLVALLLAPIFKEISFFGLKFKQAIDDLQKQISTQLAVFKADIQTTISNTSNVNVMIPPIAPPDDQLPDLEQKIKAAVSQALQEEGMTAQQPSIPPDFKVDEDTLFLFQTRHAIERKLRRIAASFTDLSEKRSPPPVGFLTSFLVKQELMNPNLVQPIRQVYSVCSPAIHGDTVTKAQVDFVRDVAPQIVDALTEIERRTIGSTAT